MYCRISIGIWRGPWAVFAASAPESVADAGAGHAAAGLADAGDTARALLGPAGAGIAAAAGPLAADNAAGDTAPGALDAAASVGIAGAAGFTLADDNAKDAFRAVAGTAPDGLVGACSAGNMNRVSLGPSIWNLPGKCFSIWNSLSNSLIIVVQKRCSGADPHLRTQICWQSNPVHEVVRFGMARRRGMVSRHARDFVPGTGPPRVLLPTTKSAGGAVAKATIFRNQ
jgi:hypothetical protein